MNKNTEISVRGYITLNSEPVVWPWIAVNRVMTRQLATIITFSVEAYLRLEYIGVNLKSSGEIDRKQFLQVDELGERGDERKYTPKFDISPDIHPHLYQYLVKSGTEDNNEMNRMILHLFECWIIAVWARGPGSSSVTHTSDTNAYGEKKQGMEVKPIDDDDEWHKFAVEAENKVNSNRLATESKQNQGHTTPERDNDNRDDGAVMVGGELVGGNQSYKHAKRPTNSPLSKYNQKK